MPSTASHHSGPAGVGAGVRVRGEVVVLKEPGPPGISVTPPTRPTARPDRTGVPARRPGAGRRHQREEDAEHPRQPCVTDVRGVVAVVRVEGEPGSDRKQHASRRRGRAPGPGRAGTATPRRRGPSGVRRHGGSGTAPGVGRLDGRRRLRLRGRARGRTCGHGASGGYRRERGGSGSGGRLPATGGSGLLDGGHRQPCSAADPGRAEPLEQRRSPRPRHRAAVVRRPAPSPVGDRGPDDVVAHHVQVLQLLQRVQALGRDGALDRRAGGTPGSVQCTLRAIRIRPSTSSCFFGRCCGTSATTCS